MIDMEGLFDVNVLMHLVFSSSPMTPAGLHICPHAWSVKQTFQLLREKCDKKATMSETFHSAPPG